MENMEEIIYRKSKTLTIVLFALGSVYLLVWMFIVYCYSLDVGMTSSIWGLLPVWIWGVLPILWAWGRQNCRISFARRMIVVTNFLKKRKEFSCYEIGAAIVQAQRGMTVVDSSGKKLFFIAGRSKEFTDILFYLKKNNVPLRFASEDAQYEMEFEEKFRAANSDDWAVTNRDSFAETGEKSVWNASAMPKEDIPKNKAAQNFLVVAVLVIGVMSMVAAMFLILVSQGWNEEISIDTESGAETELSSNAFSGEYAPSDFIQEDIDSDTVQWMCSCYAIYTDFNQMDSGYVGGLSPEHDYYADAVKVALDDGWAINGREDVEATVEWLASEGHAKEYRELLTEMEKQGLLEDGAEEAIAAIEEDDEKLGGRYSAAYHAYQEFGKTGMDGWDYCRALQVLGSCYQCGYINLEECLDASLPIAQKLQSEFDSWDEVAQSYLYGYQFWSEEVLDEYSDTQARYDIFSYLKDLQELGKGPYAVSYDTDLIDTWSGVVGTTDTDESQETDASLAKEDSEAAVKASDGYYLLYDYDKSQKVKIKVPEGYAADENSNFDYLMLFHEGDEEEEEWISREISCIISRYDQSELEDLKVEMVEEAKEHEKNTDHSECESSGVESLETDNGTAFYLREQYLYGGELYMQVYNAWIPLDDERILEVELREHRESIDQGFQQDETLLTEVFSNISKY